MRVVLASWCVGLLCVACTSDPGSDNAQSLGDGGARSARPDERRGSGEPLGRCTAPDCVIGVSAAGLRTCAAMGDGRLYCWGEDNDGELGVGEVDGYYASTPTRVLGPGGSGFLEGVVDVSMSAVNTCAVLESGRVLCWGANQRGQVGDGTQEARVAPVEVSGITNAKQVTAGFDHACALLEDGTVRCWGRNVHGQLGHGRQEDSLTPTQVVAVSGDGPLEGVVQVEAGENNTCALLDTGEVVCWGEAKYGRLGPSSDLERCTTTGRCSRRPVRVAGLESVVHIGCSWQGFCAVLASGEQRCWGGQTHGLGAGDPPDGKYELATEPVATLDPSGDRPLGGVVAVVAGDDHMCSVLRDGRLACWGNDVNQETGRLRPSEAPADPGVPAYVVGPNETGFLERIVLAAAGQDHTCAVNDAGELYCWGRVAPAGLGSETGDGCGGQCARTPRRVALPR